MTSRSLLPEEEPPGAVLATDDHQLIREWAVRRSAEPATGEATPSGPATIDVRDEGAGLRFNFPAAAPFRPITWDEWFQDLQLTRTATVSSCPSRVSAWNAGRWTAWSTRWRTAECFGFSPRR
jgi:hypothetical protein